MQTVLVQLYTDKSLFDRMRTMIESKGFVLYAIFPGYVHDISEQTLQVDSFFVRQNLISGETK